MTYREKLIESLTKADFHKGYEEGLYFKKLVEEMDNYSVDELEKEAKIIFADYIVTLGDFSEPQTSVKLFAAVSRKDTADERYKNIFD